MSLVCSERHLSSRPVANRSVCRSAMPLIGLVALRQGLRGEIPRFYLIRATGEVERFSVLGDTETAPPVMGCDLTAGESGRRLRGAVRTAQGALGRVQPVLDVWAGEVTATWQGLKGKPGESGTSGGNSAGSLIAQARKRAPTRVRSRGICSHRGRYSRPRPQLEVLRIVREALGTPALRNNQRWSVHQVRSRRDSGGTCRSSYRLTWEALRRVNRVAPLTKTLSVGDQAIRDRGYSRCGRSLTRSPVPLDARKPEAHDLTLAWTADDRQSGYNPHAWRAAGSRVDLVRHHVNQVRENNGHQTEQTDMGSITAPTLRSGYAPSHTTGVRLLAHPGHRPHGFHAVVLRTDNGLAGNPQIVSSFWHCSVHVTTLSYVAKATKPNPAGRTNRKRPHGIIAPKVNRN